MRNILGEKNFLTGFRKQKIFFRDAEMEKNSWLKDFFMYRKFFVDVAAEATKNFVYIFFLMSARINRWRLI